MSTIRPFRLAIWLAATAALWGLLPSAARADFLYQLDDGVRNERFNNSQLVETEDNWVANSFSVVAGGEVLQSITFQLGETYTNRAITAAIYRGQSLTNPNAGVGLVRIATTDTTVTGLNGQFVTIALAAPVTLAVGDIFYAALLLRGVPGGTFPWSNDLNNPQGRSFFDVGPAQGAAYNLDNTQNARVLGALNHPVVPGFVQSPGNLILRVNSTAIPEPASLALAGVGAVGLLGYAWRRRKRAPDA